MLLNVVKNKFANNVTKEKNTPRQSSLKKLEKIKEIIIN